MEISLYQTELENWFQMGHFELAGMAEGRIQVSDPRVADT
jgi:hypothetical protein